MIWRKKKERERTGMTKELMGENGRKGKKKEGKCMVWKKEEGGTGMRKE